MNLSEIPKRITREPADPMATRISLGGVKQVGYYLTFRAEDPAEVIPILEAMLEEYKLQLAAGKLPPEPEPAPDLRPTSKVISKVFFFRNGNRAVFDEHNRQISELQGTEPGGNIDPAAFLDFAKRKGYDVTNTEIKRQIP